MSLSRILVRSLMMVVSCAAWTGQALQAADDILTVSAETDLAAAGSPISRFIYGTAQTDTANATKMGLTTRRLGGNTLSSWNWKKGFWSSGADWYFVNNPKDESKAKSGKDNWWAEFHRANQQAKLEGYFTIPMMGRVAKDGTSSGFDISTYPGQQSWEAKDHPGDLHPNAGNGKRVVKGADGKDRTEELTPDPDDTSIAMSPDEQCSLLTYMIKDLGFGTAEHGGVSYIALDNEPALWNGTHRAMHPLGCSYDELWDRTRTYATILKGIDPGVAIAGPAMWGWTEYFCSGLDAQLIGQGKGSWDAPPDAKAHGGVPLTKWYLTKLAEEEKHSGKRLVDILDWHFYPQAKTGGQPHDPQGMEDRVQETRVMWDPTFKDSSWMGAQTGKVLRIIPLMKQWISECYPGTKTAIGEYDFGGGADASGGVAQSELLGVFAREGLDFGYYWFAPDEKSSIHQGFRLFRNPDDDTSTDSPVGGRYLPSTCSAPDDVSVHVFKDDVSTRISLVLINKRGQKSAHLSISLKQPLSRPLHAPVWRLDDSDPKRIAASSMELAGDRIEVDLPPISATRIDLAP